ncbi:hypothetical protein NQ318_001221 [Aromia moschata]|uniref:Uncharacterized protein n=1 Tax=Aromia moschata TaxID=1265417 RepID=A0AAV8ZGH9_9CUCU|nr:hypothetical protein NQ318_001221 [Aromia moschata]
MAHLTVTQRIEILIFIGCGNKTRTQQEVCLVHELSEDDFDQRNQFCEQMQELCTNNNFVKNVIFSDEATYI